MARFHSSLWLAPLYKCTTVSQSSCLPMGTSVAFMSWLLCTVLTSSFQGQGPCLKTSCVGREGSWLQPKRRMQNESPLSFPGTDSLLQLNCSEPLWELSGWETETLPGGQWRPSAVEGQGKWQHPIWTDHDAVSWGTVHSLYCLGWASFPYKKWDQEACRT